MSILKKLIKLSNNLDRQGLTQEADVLDKVAASWMQEAGFDEPDFSDMGEPTTTQTEVMAILAEEDEELFVNELQQIIQKHKESGKEYHEALVSAMMEMKEALEAAQSDVKQEFDAAPDEYDREKNRLERMRKPEDMSSIFDMN